MQNDQHEKLDLTSMDIAAQKRHELKLVVDWFAQWKIVHVLKNSRLIELFLFFGKVQFISAGGSKRFQKILENGLDLLRDKDDFTCSMPAEPLDFSRNLMLNSDGFFYAWKIRGEEVGYG